MAQNPPPKATQPQPPTPVQKSPDLMAPMRSWRFWITLIVLFAANVIISNLITSAGQPPTVTISYNAFLDQVNTGNLVSVTSTGDSITGVAKKPVKSQTTSDTSTKFQTQRPTFATDDLETLLRQ